MTGACRGAPPRSTLQGAQPKKRGAAASGRGARLLLTPSLGFASLKARSVLGTLIGCGRRLSEAGQTARRPAGQRGPAAQRGEGEAAELGVGSGGESRGARGGGVEEVGDERVRTLQRGGPPLQCQLRGATRIFLHKSTTPDILFPLLSLGTLISVSFRLALSRAHDVSDEVLRSCSVLPKGMPPLGTALIDMAAVPKFRMPSTLGNPSSDGPRRAGAAVHLPSAGLRSPRDLNKPRAQAGRFADSEKRNSKPVH
ncbi:uncharacterized protein LOC113180346 [Urocitellus parryii]